VWSEESGNWCAESDADESGILVLHPIPLAASLGSGALHFSLALHDSSSVFKD
jgi:hypothetical protein